MYPALAVDLNKFRHNADFLLDLCHKNGLTVAFVTKVFCADEKMTDVISQTNADFYADSRIINLKRIKNDKPKMLLRISSPSEVESVAENADISLQSEPYTIGLLGEAAKKLGKRHKVVLMIDLGDLREGIFFENKGLIYEACEKVLSYENLELFGIGTNLTCYGSVLPDEKNLGCLVSIAEDIRKKYDIELPFVSGGNSSTIEFLKEGRVPKGITNLRLGESLVLGNDTAVCHVVDGLYGDAVTLQAEIIEKKYKPSMPIGRKGKNAFGEEITYEDKGNMMRAILAIGRQDTDEGGLYPQDEKIQVIGASSDHLIVDLTQNNSYNIGDVISFTMSYGAVLKGFTSEYVNRKYIK